MRFEWELSSPLRILNPFLKAYVLLFVIMFCAFFGNITFLFLTSLIIGIILLISQISFRLLWYYIKYYGIFSIPILLILSWFESKSLITTLILTTITFTRFIIVIISGTIFGLTTNLPNSPIRSV